MPPKQRQFTFLEIEGKTGKTNSNVRYKKNRSAQLGLASRAGESSMQADSTRVMPVQIRFKASSSKQAEVSPPRSEQEQIRDPHGADEGLTSSQLFPFLCMTQLSHHSTSWDSLGEGLLQDGQSLCSSSRMREEDMAEAIAGATFIDPAVFLRVAIPPAPALSSTTLSSRDVRAIDYFRTHAALDLSGFLPGHFWDKLVLQASHTEQLVQNAVVAVGTAHQDHCVQESTSSDTLVSHGQALRSLRAYMQNAKQPRHELVLLCCILLFALSKILGDVEAATVHLKTGMGILKNARKRLRDTCPSVWTPGFTDDTLRQLSVMFIQLDIEATMQDLERGPILNMSEDPIGAQYTTGNWQPTTKFASPHEAMESWMVISHEMWAFICRYSSFRHQHLSQVPLYVREQREKIVALIQTWRTHTKHYLKTHPAIIGVPTGEPQPGPESIVDAIAALVIEGHYYCCKRFIAESLQDPNNPRPFDRHPEALLRTARTILRLRRQYHSMRNIQVSNTFTTHVGIVEALLLLAHRTTSAEVRSEAQILIRQLKDVQRGVSGLAGFFAGYGAPPDGFVLIYERPGY